MTKTWTATVAAIGLFVAMPQAALAVGMGWGDDDEDEPAAAQEAPLRSDSDLTQAAELIEAGQYEEALPLLANVLDRNPANADAYNYLGFANRQLGRFDEALDYYGQALDVDPYHLGALNYLGHAYLQMGNLPMAEVQRVRLTEVCWAGCAELDNLTAAISDYRTANRIN